MSIKVIVEKRGRKRQKKKAAKKKKDDRCTRIAKRKYKAWPSAYASGAVVQCRRGKIWKGIKENFTDEQLAENQEWEQLQEAFSARSTGMDSMFIGQSGDSGGRSYVSPEDKQEIIEKLRAQLEEEGADYLLGEEPFKDAIDAIGYKAETKKEFLSGIKDYLNSEDFQNQHGYGGGFGDEVFHNLTERKMKNKNKKGLEAKIRKALKDEGGAAGMGALKKHTEASAKDIKAAIKEMDDVGQHKDGDYILDDNKEVQIVDEVEQMVIDAIQEVLDEKKKKKRKKKKDTEGLRKWFKRKGAPGKTGGWVDCNTCRKDKKTGRKKCKPCGRQKGEKRAKYPRCRPTPAKCKGYKRRGDNLQKEGVIEEIEYNYIPAHDATYDDGSTIDFLLEFWDDVVVEAEYRGRKVKLNKPMRGDVKKFKVFVKDPKTGNVKKVNFGDPNMRIRKSNPKARKSFRARHNCDNPGPKTKARYWSCRKW